MQDLETRIDAAAYAIRHQLVVAWTQNLTVDSALAMIGLSVANLALQLASDQLVHMDNAAGPDLDNLTVEETSKWKFVAVSVGPVDAPVFSTKAIADVIKAILQQVAELTQAKRLVAGTLRVGVERKHVPCGAEALEFVMYYFHKNPEESND